MAFDLKGRTALVCGASQGIGAAIANRFAQLGAVVTLLARNETRLQSVFEELPGEGHALLALDVSDREGLAQHLAQRMKSAGAFDILVCNTGGPKGGPILEAGEQAFVSAFENHVLVNQTLASLVVPSMRDKKFGRIINIISTSVRAPIPNLGVSNTIRGAVASWAKTLSREVAVDGVTVNNILPGYTDTPRLEALLKAYQEKNGKTWQQAVEDWQNRVPMKRFAQPHEVADAAAFLASDSAGYITGVSLPVDGGRLEGI